ncbi:MAG: hypothetical protein JXP73_08585 [Deltaproteobacteria bacterium]|nr:hypothetical protein [Deltaproteobacteria bacterium]
MTTNEKRNSLLVAVLGCAAVGLFAGCAGDETENLADAGGTPDAKSTGPVTLFDFATTSQGWYFNNWQEIADGGPSGQLNLASSAVTVTGARPTIEWDGVVGKPAGSLKIVVPFTGFDQTVITNVQFSPALDWTDKVVGLDIKIEPGFDALYTGGMQLLAQDQTWAGTWQWNNWPLDSEWQPYVLNMTMAPMQTDNVVQFGVKIDSGTSAGAAVDELGNPVFTPTTVTLHVDNVVVK